MIPMIIHGNNWTTTGRLLISSRIVFSHPVASTWIYEYSWRGCIPFFLRGFGCEPRILLNHLVGASTPVKNMKFSWDYDIPNRWRNKTCSTTTNQINSGSTPPIVISSDTFLYFFMVPSQLNSRVGFINPGLTLNTVVIATKVNHPQDHHKV